MQMVKSNRNNPDIGDAGDNLSDWTVAVMQARPVRSYCSIVVDDSTGLEPTLVGVAPDTLFKKSVTNLDAANSALVGLWLL